MKLPTEPPRTSSRSAAFSLIEAVLSMGIAAILLVGMAAALRMSISGAHTGSDGSTRALAAQAALEQIRAELATATVITSLSAESIAFTVPDRDADGQPESLEYTWPGSPGSTLTREFNGASAPWITDVRSLRLAEVLRSPPVAQETAEAALAACEFTPQSTPSEAPINSSNAVAVFFRIPQTQGTQSWTLRRFRVSLRRETTLLTPATVNAALHTADSAGRPAGAALATQSVTISLGASNLVPAFIEFPLSVPSLNPSSGYCVVLSSPNPSAVRATILTTGGAFNTHLLRSSDAGSTWSAPNDTDELRFQVLGTTTTLREVD